MGANTKISWADDTFNIWVGCTPVGPGCDNCYAQTLSERHGWAKWGFGEERHFFKGTTTELLKWDRKARKTGMRRKVFVGDLSDVLDNEVEQKHRDELWKLIEQCDALDFQILTKRVGNAKRMLPASWLQNGLPDHVWFGITVVNQEEAERDIPKLSEIPARIRFLSIEPVLGPILIQREWPIDWAIIGGESGDNRRDMELGWLHNIVAQCRVRNIPVWVKQDSSRMPGQQGRISDAWWIHEFPERQDRP